jgi:hypothetical protein
MSATSGSSYSRWTKPLVWSAFSTSYGQAEAEKYWDKFWDLPKVSMVYNLNFRCADVICDFCGYLAQVKTTERADVNTAPGSLMGAAWEPQNERMAAGIYFPLFIVVANADRSASAVY